MWAKIYIIVNVWCIVIVRWSDANAGVQEPTLLSRSKKLSLFPSGSMLVWFLSA